MAIILSIIIVNIKVILINDNNVFPLLEHIFYIYYPIFFLKN